MYSMSHAQCMKKAFEFENLSGELTASAGSVLHALYHLL